MLKAVLFDVDGTLGDTLSLCIEAYRVVTEEVTGRRPAPEEVTHFFGLSDRGVLAGLLGMSYDDPALPIDRFAEIYTELLPSLAPVPFPGTVEVLRALKGAGLRIGLISGKEDYTAAPTLTAYGMDGLFEWQGLGLPYCNAKTQRLREYLEHTGLQSADIIYVGDMPSDITSCREAGVRIVSAAWAPTAAQDEAACLALHPDYRLTDIHDLLPLLTSL